MEKKLVIIPTYKEVENIAKIISAVFALEGNYHILVIDDGSPDGTADVVKSLQKAYTDTLFLIQRPGKMGLGTAYVTGFRWALDHGYDYSKWTRTFPTTPRTCPACTGPAPKKAPTCP